RRRRPDPWDPGGREDRDGAERGEERFDQGTGSRVVRFFRAGRRSAGGRRGPRRARRQGRAGGRAHRAPDLPGPLPRQGRHGRARRGLLMLRFDRRLLLNVDWPLVGATFFIIALSVLSLWSLAPGRGGGVLAWRQLSWVGVGVIALLVVVSVDYRSLVRAAPAFYAVGVALLLTVFVLGRSVSGARRWIHLGPITVQPSELF